MPVDFPEKQLPGSWLQTERAAHESWAKLIAEAPKAAQLMHLLVARIGEHNAVVISQKNLIRLMGASRPTVQRAVKKLRDDLWVEVRQIGDRGTTNAYIINDRIAWRGKRDGIRYSLFSAAVVISDDEQPDLDTMDHHQPLRRIPSIGRGEQQLPVGPGLPPPSEPSLPGMEHDLPSTENDFENKDKDGEHA
jgi:DNA-binding transcriptional MocR family regulator